MSVCQSSSFALSILLVCCAMIHCAAAQSNSASTVYIVPASDSPPIGVCPGEPCLTIDQYVSNSSLRDGVTDVTLELQPGCHNLSVPFTIDGTVTTDFSSIAMTGTVRDVTLLCTEEFTFSFIDSVRISGINLVNCGGLSTHIRNVENFTLEDSTFASDMPFRVRLSANPVIVNSVFSNCTSGALSIIESGQLMIRNCTFSNNVKRSLRIVPGYIDGGVIHLNSINTFIDQCTFKNNTAMYTSGAIFFTNGGLSVTNSYFFNNSAIQSSGGAINSGSGSISIRDSNFTNNSGHNGGAVSIGGEGNTIVITQCDFLNNTAVFEGGAIQISKANQDLSQHLSTRIDNSRFVGNSAARGGALLKRGFNIFFSTFQSSYVNNSCSSTLDTAGAIHLIIGRAEVVVTQAIFTKNQGFYGAFGVLGADYSVTVQDSTFLENIAASRGGAISSDTGNFTIRDSEFHRNSAPQCGAVDFRAEDTNINTGPRDGLTVKILACTFANNSATVGRGGALCASDNMISVSISGFGFTPISTFRQNSAVTGGGAISTNDSVLTISGASFSDNSARSGGDAIHACSSQVTVESADGLLSGSTDGQCLLFNNNMTFPNGGVSSYAMNLSLPLFLFMIMLANKTILLY